MYQDGGIHHRGAVGVAVGLREEHLVGREGKEHAQRHAQQAGHQGDDEVLAEQLHEQLHPGAAKGTAHPNLADTLAQAALRHAAQVDGRHDEQDEEDDEATAAGSMDIRLPVGSEGQGILLLVVGAIAVVQLPALLADHLVELVAAAVALLADGIKVIAAAGQDGAGEHPHVVAPDILGHIGGGVGNPDVAVGTVGNGRDILHHAADAVGYVGDEELLACGFGGAEEAAGHALADDGHRPTGIEGGLIVRLTVEEGEVEDAPIVIIGLAHLGLEGGLSGQGHRIRFGEDHVEGDGLGRGE